MTRSDLLVSLHTQVQIYQIKQVLVFILSPRPWIFYQLKRAAWWTSIHSNQPYPLEIRDIYSKDAGNYENPGSYYVLNDRLQAISTFYEIISSNEIWNITKQTEVKKLLYN